MSKVTKEYIDGMAPVCNYIIACVYVQNESLVGTLCARGCAMAMRQGLTAVILGARKLSYYFFGVNAIFL